MMFADRDHAAADMADALLGISTVEEERRRELMLVVHHLAEADRTVDEVRQALLGPYGGLLRLKILARRSAKGIARVSALNGTLDARFREVATFPRGDRLVALLRERLRLQLEAEAELVASLSPERRAIVESLRAGALQPEDSGASRRS